MSCTFCNKSASELSTRSLCNCCLVHLESCDATTEKSTPAAWDWEEDAVRTVECPVCLEEYQENELQQHRENCKPRLVLRCSLCDEDYLSEESLFKHLIEHKIAHEKKGLFYQKKKVTYKQYTCVLCNDQRSYRECSYWEHVHEDHDGFYLQCAECGENFRSKKLKTDHDLNHCKSKEQTITFESEGLEMEDGSQQKQNEAVDEAGVVDSCGQNVTLIIDSDDDIEEVPLSHDQNHSSEQNVSFESDDLVTEAGYENTNTDNHSSQQNQVNAADDVDSCEQNVTLITDSDDDIEEVSTTHIENRSGEPSDIKCPHCNKEYESDKKLARHIRFCHEPGTCDVCGLSFDTGNMVNSHKRTKHKHLERNFPCPLCKSKFLTEESLSRHMKGIHLRYIIPASSSGSEKQEPPHNTEMIRRNVKTDCPICQENFSDPIQVSQHVKEIHQRTMCTTCRAIFAEANKQSNHECSLCPHCGKDGFNRRRLITHIDMCHAKYTCNVCDVSVVGRHKLWKHKQRVHSEPKIKCSQCSKLFYQEFKYAYHLPYCNKLNSITCVTSLTNSVTKPQETVADRNEKQSGDILDVEETSQLESEDRMLHGQSECNVTVENDNAHKDAIKTNNSESSQVSKLERKIKPIKIRIPSGTASSAQKLDIKRPHHHRQSIGRVFPCKLCGRKFKTSTCIRKHIKQMHSVRRSNTATIKMEISVEETQLQPQDNQVLKDAGRKSSSKPKISSSSKKCPYCDKIFKETPLQRASLLRHIKRNHTKRTCSDCGASFENKVHLAYHVLKSHSDPKYKCAHCSEIFHVETAYEQHVDKQTCKTSLLKHLLTTM